LLEPWSDSAPFHVIASNLPYIGLAELPQIDKSVADYEPHLALFSTGPHGAELIQRLAAAAPERLIAGGLLALEISPYISQEVQQILRGGDVWTDVAVRRDLAGHDRIVLAQTKV
jgi:release factor glutamine methyltransferase